jgi:hypothetical protein
MRRPARGTTRCLDKATQGGDTLSTTCTLCGDTLPGWPDDDRCCQWCEQANFAGDPLRHPPRREAHPRPWWEDARLPLPPRPERRLVEAPWVWREEVENA